MYKTCRVQYGMQIVVNRAQIKSQHFFNIPKIKVWLICGYTIDIDVQEILSQHTDTKISSQTSSTATFETVFRNLRQFQISHFWI